MSVQLKGGKVLLVGGKVATDSTCCCGGGACCQEDGSCTHEDSEEACTEIGGTFHDGAPCSPNPCVECSDSIELCKCGFTEYASPSTPPKYYLVETYSSLRTISPESCLDSDHNFTCDPNLNCIANQTTTYDSLTCVPSIVGSTDPGAPGNTAHEELCDGTVIDPAGDCSDLDTTIRALGTKTSTTINYTPADSHHNNVGCTPVDVTLHLEGHITLSSEYTTATLIANTLAQFAASCHCPEGYVVTYELNEDESCCTASCVPE